GQVGWGRISAQANRPGSDDVKPARSGARPIQSSPVGIFLRESAGDWFTLARRNSGEGSGPALSTNAEIVRETLEKHGASFFAGLVKGANLLPTQVEVALAELAAAGVVTSDSYAGLRALLVPTSKRNPIHAPSRWRRRMAQAAKIESAG